MHRLFGKKKEAGPAPSLGDASTSINNRVGAIDEKIKGLDGELIKFKEQLKKAKGPAADNIKRRALQTLKRKKMYESQRDQMAGQAFNVEQTSFAIDSVKDTQTTIFAMQAASKQLKVEHTKIDLGAIEDMQDDLGDMFEDMDEINDLMGRSYGTPDGLDEDDLEAELAGLDFEELEGEFETETVEVPTAAYSGESLPISPATSAYSLPSAPVGSTKTNAQDELHV
mmetsp:Transcript_7787/g.7862  ORF Transcript_7787/g.7862 Transcript_7787/m.7862 type:complete len:226 (+) Transcript_7787:212-889(+)|eukprot:CAMPEP_0119041524 /NCGR_PEP_ID=MMETSP1177-20130426/12521_1 /TAXON_ID=2985 /ORGANISM="Ochromonas sp, Strain CCMP1899" /LENGTH=225 /DNA_ID=CAMNT_0007007647 /DNA_START=198 /DNA_END=875 /DNA_ORIENTATION=-